MAARVVLVLFTILAGASAWLGDYACENVVSFGSRLDVEQCFQDRFPEQIAELFLRCAQNSHVSRAYTVLQDYCQNGQFQDEINTCMNQEEGVTLVTQNVAFRTLRTCLDWIPRSIPDENSESNEDSDRALRKRDLSENEVDVDEKAPKEGEQAEESPKNSEELTKEETVIVTEDLVAPTDAPAIFVTEIISLAEELTEATASDETNDIEKNEEAGENSGPDVVPNEDVDETANDITPADIENASSQTDEEGEKDTNEEAVKVEDDDDDEVVDLGNDEESSPSEESDKEDDKEDNPSGEPDADDDNNSASDDSNTSKSEESDKEDDKEDNPSGESDTDDDNNSASDDGNSSNNDDPAEYDFEFPVLVYPVDFFSSDEADDEDGSRKGINERYNVINFAIYVNKK